MGKYIFLFAAVVFFYGIITSNGTNRLMWFFAGFLFFQDRIIVFESPSIMNFNRFLVYSLLLSELLRSKKMVEELLQFPLIRPLTIVFIGMLCIGVLDERHSIFLSIYRLTDEFIQSFFILFLAYANFKREDRWEKILPFFLVSSFILCTYGFLNYFLKINPIDSFITSTYNSLSSFDQYIFSGRFRINSFVSHPIYYGYLLSVLFLLFLYGLHFTRKYRIFCLGMLPMVFLNLILTNARTSYIAFFLGLTSFILLGLNSRKRLQIMAFTIVVSIIIYNIPLINGKVEVTIDAFEKGGGHTSGSSLEMRSMQLRASYNEFLKNPIIGNGLYYINENMGWNKNPEMRTSDDDLEGFESYVYHLLIEQGLIGIIINIIFFTSLMVYFFKNISLYKELAALGLSILIMFLTFIIGTGTLGSWAITMGILGLIIAIIESNLNGFSAN